MARSALKELGPRGAGLLCADPAKSGLTRAVVAAGRAWDDGDRKLAEAKLAHAVELADRLRYF